MTSVKPYEPVSVRNLKTGRRYADVPLADRRQDRRNRFLDCALTAFAVNGYRRSTIAEVCKLAGLSSRQFYEEFTGREALLRELYDSLSRDAYRALTDGLFGRDQQLPEAINAGVTAYIAAVAADSRVARLLFVEAVGVSGGMELLRHGSADRLSAVFWSWPELRTTAFLGAVDAVALAWSCMDPRPPVSVALGALSGLLQSERSAA